MEETGKVRFHYLKTSSYRDCHCDGVFGGRTPNGSLWIGFFSERAPVPKEAVHIAIPVSGQPGAFSVGEFLTEESDVKAGIIRTLEVGVFMNLETAETFQKWLEGHIGELRKGRGK